MRDTFEWIDGATEDNEDLRHALRDVAAQQIATQALAIAFASRVSMTVFEAEQLVEKVAGYPGVTGRTMRDDSKLRVGERAAEIMVRLARLRPGFITD